MRVLRELRLEPAPAAGPTRDERNWAVLCHLAAALGFLVPLGNVVGPLLIWQLKRRGSAYVDYHGAEAVNFQISTSIYFGASLLLISLQIRGWPLLIGGWLLLCVVFCWFLGIFFAALRASRVEPYRYPFAIRLFS